MNKKLPDIKNDVAGWYQEVIYQAELADQSPVRGCIVIRPYGNALWENIKTVLDKRIKETGHQNALFPLLIPQSFFEKEAEHVEGFSPELAIVTHAGGKKLEEPLAIRPTSETMVHYMFARWIRSWRDLPMKINQWANVVRWEMRSRAFLRTTEIFWQEGHTAHETQQEANKEAEIMMQEYVNLAENYLAIPVVQGTKSEAEKFPGADKTLTFEALMPDGKALQMGTSHLISQNFAKTFDMSFQNKEGKLAYPYLTSWGVTTRLVGALVLVNGDQKGLALPPKIAPIQVVIVPFLKKNADNLSVLDKVSELEKQLKNKNIKVFVDDDISKSPGSKLYKWEVKGVPVRIEVGPRDLEKNEVVIADRISSEKKSVNFDDVQSYVVTLLEQMQQAMFENAKKRMQDNWHQVEKLADFGKQMKDDGGFYQTGWCLNPACEQELKKYQAFTRCLLEEQTKKECFNCSKESATDVLVAKAY